ncbi:cutinase family protein [Nocardia sp. CA-136227]|uniref:cutinase family protein n=1 Tax=Nocardia sp. CA-136227 TaxID=3239979 RepID=UPI003D998C16
MGRAMALLAALLMNILIPIAPAMISQAGADSCVGTWTIGIGGGDNVESAFTPYADRVITYSSVAPVSAIDELDLLFWSHRAECPGDHIRLIGHSQGAAIVHAWITAHPNAANANAILLADPKRAPGPGGGGVSATPGNSLVGYPLAGVDDWFGNVPVLTVCNHDDPICDASATWRGYAEGAHLRYDFDVNDYGNWDSGVWYR